MAKILGHEIVNAEEFGQFIDGEYTTFKTAVQETSKANAEMLIHFANTTEKHKKELRLLKIAFCVTIVLLVIGVFAIMH
jgi:hypothetical protein